MKKQNLRSLTRKISFTLLAGLCLATTGCGPRFTVQQVEPLVQTLESETLSLSNREAESETELVSGLVFQRSVAIDNFGTRGSDDWVLIPEDLLAEMQAELELVYAPAYEEITNTVQEIQLTTPPGKIRAFKVDWIAQKYDSAISFRMGIKSYKTRYTYELRIPRLIDFVEIDCSP